MKKSLVELTEEEFIKKILNTIDDLKDNIFEIEKQQDQFHKLYRNYLIDKQKFVLKYFIRENTLYYERHQKPRIGYKLGGGNKNE